MSKPHKAKIQNIPEGLIKELLTPSEARMLSNRWYILNLLGEGLPIRVIAEEAKVGTDTVVRVAKMLEGNPKIKAYLGKPQKPSGPKWIFGQIGSKE